MTYEEMEELERKYANHWINTIEFLNAIPDEYIPHKAELIKIFEEKENDTR